MGTVLAVGLFYLAFITGGWAASAGASFFTLVTGDIPVGGDLTTTRWIGVGLMGAVFAITLFGKKISRTLELLFWVLVLFILVTLFAVVLILTPPSAWLDGVVGMLRPALPPEGTAATTIGAVAGFAAVASGLNFVFTNYYRDKGYGMGSRTGYIPVLLARGEGRPEIAPVGTTFPETPENAARWRRWWFFLKLEMWAVFVPGAIIGMLLPGILVSHLTEVSGVKPTVASMPTFVADQLRATGESSLFFGWALFIGFVILFKTQIVVFEMLTRNMVDALYGSSAGFRRLIAGDPRRFYYPFMIVLGVVISVIIFRALPVTLVQWAANMSNLAAMIFPFALMYLIGKLPRPPAHRGGRTSRWPWSRCSSASSSSTSPWTSSPARRWSPSDPGAAGGGSTAGDLLPAVQRGPVGGGPARGPALPVVGRRRVPGQLGELPFEGVADRVVAGRQHG